MISLNSKGHVKERESQILEFKQSIQFGDSMKEYARTLVGMANNQGGLIVFGVKNKPHTLIGVNEEKFENFDPAHLNQILLEYFSNDVEWTHGTSDLNGTTFAYFKVDRATIRPVICSKSHNNSKLREGAVYYRYRGETREIRYSELKNILDEERDREKRLWMSHIQSIATIGPQSVQIVDAVKGEMNIGGTKILIDKDLINKLKVVKEGHFKEDSGAPALRLVGEIGGLLKHDHVIYTEAAYPHTQSHFLEKLPINSRDFQALIWKFKMKGNSRYHGEFKTGKSSVVQKYSEKALAFLRDKIRNNERLLPQIKKEYSEFQKQQRNK